MSGFVRSALVRSFSHSSASQIDIGVVVVARPSAIGRAQNRLVSKTLCARTSIYNACCTDSAAHNRKEICKRLQYSQKSTCGWRESCPSGLFSKNLIIVDEVISEAGKNECILFISWQNNNKKKKYRTESRLFAFLFDAWAVSHVLLDKTLLRTCI